MIRPKGMTLPQSILMSTNGAVPLLRIINAELQ